MVRRRTRRRAGPGTDTAGQVVIAACEAHVCLMQTALGLLRKGRQVVGGRTGVCSGVLPTIAWRCSALGSAGATLVSPEMVLFEWPSGVHHPKFKTVLQLIKSAPSAPSTASGR